MIHLVAVDIARVPSGLQDTFTAIIWIMSVAGLGYHAAQIEIRMEKRIDLVERRIEVDHQGDKYEREIIDKKVDQLVKRFEGKMNRFEVALNRVQGFLSKNTKFIPQSLNDEP